MTQEVISPKRDPVQDEAVWKAWLQKNAEQDRVQSVRLAKFAGIAVVLGILVFLWLWNTNVHSSQPVPATANYFLVR
jgi:hypothetical protein